MDWWIRGLLEWWGEWSIGVMEGWSDAVQDSRTPLLHYSIRRFEDEDENEDEDEKHSVRGHDSRFVSFRFCS